MTKDELTDETIAAQEAGDHDRLRELGELERRGKIGDEPPKYLDRSDAEDGGESALQKRAESALGMAVDEALRDSLRSVADAEDPETVLRQEIAHAEGHATEELASALRELRPSDE